MLSASHIRGSGQFAGCGHWVVSKVKRRIPIRALVRTTSRPLSSAAGRGVILADTSAWVEFDRATGSTVDVRLTRLITDDGPIAVTEPVMMEVLAGARTDTGQRDLRRLLHRFHLHSVDPAPDFEAAARIYRQCRHNGVTPRGLIHCLMAAVAWRNNATLLAYDIDLHRLAGIVGIGMDPASHRA